MHLRTPYWWAGVWDSISCQVASVTTEGPGSVIPTKTTSWGGEKAGRPKGMTK